MIKIPVRFAAAFICLCMWVYGYPITSFHAASGDAPVANPPAGKLRGVREGDAIAFRAVPYALPPTRADAALERSA